MRSLKVRICTAMFSVIALSTVATAAGLNPPKVTDSTPRSITIRQVPGYEARCFKESSFRERGEWTNPKKASSDYVTKVEMRNGIEFITLTMQQDTTFVKVLLELDQDGGVRKVPPLLESNIPGFEKEYGSQVTKLVTQMISASGESFLGRTFEVGKDYGANGNLCAVLSAQTSGSLTGKTVLEGTLTYAGRPAYLFSGDYEQACSTNGVRFTVEASAWTLHDQLSGLAMSSASKFELFSQGTRYQQGEEFLECGVTEKQ